MTSTQSGIAAQRKREQRARLAGAQQAWHRHRQLCYPCRLSQPRPDKWCPDGYKLAYQLHQAYRALRNDINPTGQQQDPLL